MPSLITRESLRNDVPPHALLLRVQLNDQVFVDFGRQVATLGHSFEHALHLLDIDIQPLGEAALLGQLEGGLHMQLLSGPFGDGDDIAGFDLITRNVHLLAVHKDAVVADQLARLGTGGAETHAMGHGIQTALQQLQQALTGRALAAVGLGVVTAELILQHAVDAAQLLLLTQLNGVVGQATAALAVLAGRNGAFFHCALRRVTLFAFEEEFLSLTTTQPTFRTYILCLANLPSLTRRFFGGRHPLWGIGVTSVMLLTLKPTACRPRTAESRPGPGPFTNTSTFFTPNSCATWPALSAATCAAKGVLLREPLKPQAPADDHDRVLPWRSVMVMMVLLNEAWMCATASTTFFFTRLRVRAGGFAIFDSQ